MTRLEGDHANVTEGTDDKLVPTMLNLDAKFGQCSTFVSICIQRPQLLVALDFLLAIIEFFVPTVGNMLSTEEDNKYLHVDAILMDKSTYRQPAAEFSLSPCSPLIVEDERFDHFIYDGEGRILYLKDRHGFCLSSPSSEAMIYVGNGKSLQFKNVVIKSGQYLDSCISLGTNSRYSASWDDGVYFEAGDGPHLDSVRESSNAFLSQTTAGGRYMEFILELQAIGPELTFYTASKDVGDSPILRNKLLHAQLDAFGRLVLKGDTTEVTANAIGLTMESNGIQILEPFDTYVKYSNASRKTNIHLSISEIFMNFSFRSLRLFLAVEEDILEFLRMTSKKMTVVCSQFDKVGTIRNPDTDQVYAFWRPHAPPGFAVLGDYLTPLDKPPTRGVLVVNTNVVRVKRALSFRLIWPPSSGSEGISNEPVTVSSSENGDLENECSVWFPEAPKGYVALGCVVSQGITQPSRSSTFCILASLVSPCSLRDCVTISSRNICPSSLLFWRVDNCVGTFLSVDPRNSCLLGRAYDLRHILFGISEVTPKISRQLDVHASQSGDVQTLKPEILSAVNSGPRYEAVASFHLIWWNRGSSSRKKLSIWRPVVPHGMVFFGDVAMKGYEPPNTCIVLRDDGDEELLKAPLGFQIVGKINKQKGMENVSFWLPQAPPGFVSLGCVAFKGTPKQHDFSTLRCVRSDVVAGDQFSDESVWDTSDAKLRSEPFSIWSVVNELNTFIVRSGFKKPPRRFALKLADRHLPSGTDSTVIDAEIRTFSASLFDDYGGLMVPLFNLSLSKMSFSLHGRTDCMNSTISFSLAARSYNDKYDSWEPLVEPVDGFLRLGLEQRRTAE
ncbi:uncharacterized protein LOC110810874 isoform X2 [Carica papaya]|uniref:uncharacterized protein LOC110810874 isoform X2 n=1 Tax=Carica papaya TaxID=3649 RepID=UPI000B8CECB7|nr:uncharacterized protein LOC110810874 isoform X2 [Carica papaya]